MGLGWKFKCSGVKHSCDNNNLSRVTGSVSHVWGWTRTIYLRNFPNCNKCINSPSRPLPTPYPAGVGSRQLFGYRRVSDWTGFCWRCGERSKMRSQLPPHVSLFKPTCPVPVLVKLIEYLNEHQRQC